MTAREKELLKRLIAVNTYESELRKSVTEVSYENSIVALDTTLTNIELNPNLKSLHRSVENVKKRLKKLKVGEILKSDFSCYELTSQMILEIEKVTDGKNELIKQLTLVNSFERNLLRSLSKMNYENSIVALNTTLTNIELNPNLKSLHRSVENVKKRLKKLKVGEILKSDFSCYELKSQIIFEISKKMK